jgi:uncharacterized protein YndB with AHSA1/START domain
MPTKLQINTALKIQKPAHDVFDAIVNPEKMSNYFISKSTGRMEEGKTLTWQFPEFDMQFPVYVDKVEKDKLISYRWKDFEDGLETRVDILIEEKQDGVLVTITEREREANEKGIQWLKSNTGGWANFLACLKAYLEYGINLRKGAFDISQMPKESSEVL